MKINKSGLPFGVAVRLRDPAYLESAKDRACEVDPAHDSSTVCACHVRLFGSGGTARKPDDSLVLFLCRACHDEFDGRVPGLHGADFIVKNIVMPELRRRHRWWQSFGDQRL